MTGLFALLLIVGCGGRKRLPVNTSVDTWHDDQADRPGVPVLIRVGVQSGKAQARLSWRKPVVLLNGDHERLARFNGPGSVVVTQRDRRISWTVGGRSGNADALFVQPVDPGHAVVFSETAYPGEMLLLPLPGGMSVINQVDLEKYLRGVVPWEIGRPGPEAEAAVAAQAVAARTYTVAHLGRQRELGFDVWADVRDQVYRGLEGLDPVCDAAIRRTNGLVLRHGGSEIEAYYCSTCGGTTSNVHEVWPHEKAPFLRSITDTGVDGSAFCAEAGYYTWTESWTGVELEEILQQTLPEYVDYMREAARREWAGEVFEADAGGGAYRRPGALLGLNVVSRTSSGRIARLDIRTEAGTYHLRGDRVRWVLAPMDGRLAILRSAFFDLEVEKDGGGWPVRISLRGRGFGHGIGMCQTGALARARSGQSFREILAAYYPGAEVVKAR